MNPQSIITIGLFGFGVVGEGLHKVLQETPGLRTRIKKICIQDPAKHRNAPAELFTTDRDELLNDPEINVIVEVINDADAAFLIAATAMSNGKSVVSASKKMIAEHLPALIHLQKLTGQSCLYEAAACASIPVIRNLEEYYDNSVLHSIRAIVNGSTNFIITRMIEEKLSFQQALLLAQQAGFAEKDPGLDINGYDSVYKFSFLLTHAYGIMDRFDTIVFNGIQHLHSNDHQVALQKGYQIRLVAQANQLSNGKIAAFVLPQFIQQDDPLSFIKNEYNGVLIESHFADQQFFYGKGAGSLPTASALLSDIAALRYGYKYEYKKLGKNAKSEITMDFYLRVYVGFSDLKHIPVHKFTWIEEHTNKGRESYLTGVIHFTEIFNNYWWEENEVSLIVLPQPVLESEKMEELKAKLMKSGSIIVSKPAMKSIKDLSIN